ncbi:MAG TPA: TPM domain-containing protein, partial [Steroidobacteraceae bacterium]
MKLRRLLRHLFTTRWAMLRRFTPEVLAQIEEAVRTVEANHAGEVRFVIETALDVDALLRDMTPRQRAAEVFAQLGVWDTEDNNGVLIYVL